LRRSKRKRKWLLIVSRVCIQVAGNVRDGLMWVRMMIFSIWGEATSYMCASACVNLPDSCPFKNEKKTWQIREEIQKQQSKENHNPWNLKQTFIPSDLLIRYPHRHFPYLPTSKHSMIQVATNSHFPWPIHISWLGLHNSTTYLHASTHHREVHIFQSTPGTGLCFFYPCWWPSCWRHCLHSI